MGEMKFRSDESRKNYERQEAKRRQAAQRKAFQQKKEELLCKCRTWVKENPKRVACMAAAAVMAIVLIWLGCKWFVGPGGSLPNFFGYVRGIEDSWVVADLNPRTNSNRGSSNVDSTSYGKTPVYFHLATLTPLEGFEQEIDYSLLTNNANQDQHYTNTDKSGMVESVYVFGIPNKTATKHVADMQNVMGLTDISSDVMSGRIAGYDVHYVYFIYDQEPDENGVVSEAYSSLCMCIDTSEDACLLVVINSFVVPKAEILPVEDMVDFSEKVLSNLTVY